MESDSAKCYSCRKYANYEESSFSNDGIGFRNWPKALDGKKGFLKHEKSNIHEESYKARKRRQLLDRGEGWVSTKVSVQSMTM